MTEYNELPIQRVAGVWGQVEPKEGSLYLKLEQNDGESGDRNLASIILVDYTGEKIDCGNVLFFNFNVSLNGMIYVYPSGGVSGSAYICRNNKTNGIYIIERE